MKTHNKIIFGLLLGIVAFFAHQATFGNRQAMAACPPNVSCTANPQGLTTDQLDKATYKYISAREIDMTVNGTVVKFIDSEPTKDPVNYKPQNTTLFCDGTTYGHDSLADKGKGITLNTNFNDLANNTTSVKAGVELDYNDTSGICSNYQNTIYFVKQADGTIIASPTTSGLKKGDGCTTGKDCANGTCQKDGGDCQGANQTSPSCESSFNGTMTWILCPILHLSDDVIGAFNGFVEAQLCVNAGQSATAGNVSCGTASDTIMNKKLEKAWNSFRLIATSLLVVVMLIMVFSQTFSIGPFDAYTLRKLLPRLVAAAILIQLSWQLAKFAIDISNDLGTGVQQIMYAPFGGASNLDLSKILPPTVKDAVGTGTGAQGLVLFGAIAGLGAAVANLPSLLLLALYVVVAIFVAFVTLVIRQVLIVALIVVVPLALLAWILPGTEKVWKQWSNNFTKLLLMFPMIMALIAAGRIFAYISAQATTGTAGGAMFTPRLGVAHVGSLPVPYLADASAFVGLVVVIVAFFAPYFMLPMTFKWGGSFMRVAGDAVSKAGQRIGSKDSALGKGIEGFAQRNVTGKFAKKYSPDDGLLKRTGMSVLGGRMIPTRYQQALLAQRGDKWNEEREAEARAVINRGGEKARSGYDTKLRMDDGSEAVYERELDPETGQQRYVSKKWREEGIGGKFTDEQGDAAKRAANEGEEADIRHFTGVQAMKQYWVDRTEEGKDDFEKKVAVKLLRATSSWPELQGSFTKNGKRVVDTDIWNPTITTDSESYPAVLRSRVDHVPHLDDKAKKDLEKELKVRPKMNQTERQDFVSGRRLYYAVTQQMSNEDFSSQSDGFWDEMKRVSFNKDGSQTKIGKDLQGALKSRLEAIHSIGGTAPQQLLGHLANGGPLQQTVNAVITANPKAATSAPGGILSYIGTRDASPAREGRAPARPVEQQQTATVTGAAATDSGRPAAQTPQQTVVKSGEAELIIRHQEPRVVTLQGGETASPGGVILPSSVGNELSDQLSDMRKELKDLKRMGTRNQEQEKRLEQIQSSHPDWEDDETKS